MSGAPLLRDGRRRRRGATTSSIEDADVETVEIIKELIETRVRPAVANDGGDITFRGFKDGVVYPDDAGRLLGLPVLDRHAAPRHREPAAPLRAGRHGSAPGLTGRPLAHRRMSPGSGRLRRMRCEISASPPVRGARHSGCGRAFLPRAI